MITKIAVTYTLPELKHKAEHIAQRLQLKLVTPDKIPSYPAIMIITPQRLTLTINPVKEPAMEIYVDFVTGSMRHRCQYGGGRKQLLARAIGLHKKKTLSICDVSAGLGRDAFILAYLGAQITMIERSPIIGALLEDGWQRAQDLPSVKKLFWQLHLMDSKLYLQQLLPNQYPQVIYLDPMYPIRKKSALVKKEMRILRAIVGDNEDATELLNLALMTARERVVVKRPRLASPLLGPKPSQSLEGKSSRFDIYLV